MEKIILSAGGTGGHVFPACALSMELRKNGFYTILITDQRGEKYIKNEFNEVIILPISTLNWKFFVYSPFLFIRCLLKGFRVKKTIGFGGYSSLFPMLIAMISFKKFFIVQLDSIVTRLNHFFLNYACQVFYLFPQTSFKKFLPNFYLTGIPLRSGFEFSFIRHSQENFVISILGGSLGSTYWKDLIFQFARDLDPKIRQSISFCIQTEEDISFLDCFSFKSIETKAFFDTKMLFKKSHLIISRCGANTLAEIVSVGRPAFLVPWEKSMENHQQKNAENLLFFDGCRTGDQSDLLEFFSRLYDDESFFVKTCSNMASSFEFNGKKRIVEIIHSIK